MPCGPHCLKGELHCSHSSQWEVTQVLCPLKGRWKETQPSSSKLDKTNSLCVKLTHLIHWIPRAQQWRLRHQTNNNSATWAQRLQRHKDLELISEWDYNCATCIGTLVQQQVNIKTLEVSRQVQHQVSSTKFDKGVLNAMTRELQQKFSSLALH